MSAVGFTRWLLIARHDPLECVLEVVEAAHADPTILIERRVPLTKLIVLRLEAERGPAELTVVVAPRGVRGVLTIRPSDELHAAQVSLPALETPIGLPLCHVRVPHDELAFSRASIAASGAAPG